MACPPLAARATTRREYRQRDRFCLQAHVFASGAVDLKPTIEAA
jgi:hypothetical protein